MITLTDLERLAELFDELDIPYITGCLFKWDSDGNAVISGYWFNASEIDIKINSLPIENEMQCEK